MKKRSLFPSGERGYMLSRYRDLYGEGEYEGIVRDEQKKLKRLYLLIIVFTAAVLAMLWFGIAGQNAVVKTDGNGMMVSVKRPDKAQGAVMVNARVWAVSDSGRASAKKQLLIEPEGRNSEAAEEGLLRNESESDRLERRISSAVRSLNNDTGKGTVKLPSRLDDGTKLYWQKTDKNNYPLILAGCLLLLLLVYRSRYSRITKEEKAARECIIRELPGFINKLVLLLNAGLILNNAFDKIICDREAAGENRKNYFYDQLKKIYIKTRETNCPMHTELSAFAKRSGVREMMRLSNIITDNISKGTYLADKLRREGEMLWFVRKKQSEEKGRLAETKLTLPLLILLLVLVMITIAPAMMDM